MVKVLLVDDQALVRKGLHRLLDIESDIEVVGECEDGDQVLKAVANLQPDIVLMDVRMKRMDGISAVEVLYSSGFETPVAMLTTFGDDEVLWKALEAGASGFILKDASTTELLRATHVVAAGGAWLDPKITNTVIEHYRLQHPNRAIPNAGIETLTAREKQVLVLLAEGLLNQEIANKLCISEATIKTHISHIFSKLGARDRAAAIVYAYDHGIVLPRS